MNTLPPQKYSTAMPLETFLPLLPPADASDAGGTLCFSESDLALLGDLKLNFTINTNCSGNGQSVGDSKCLKISFSQFNTIKINHYVKVPEQMVYQLFKISKIFHTSKIQYLFDSAMQLISITLIEVISLNCKQDQSNLYLKNNCDVAALFQLNKLILIVICVISSHLFSSKTQTDEILILTVWQDQGTGIQPKMDETEMMVLLAIYIILAITALTMNLFILVVIIKNSLHRKVDVLEQIL